LPEERDPQGLNFASTTQPVYTTQQCSYMGAWASQATMPFIKHICRNVEKTEPPKPDTKTPKKQLVEKKHGERVPPTKAVVQPLGF